MKKSLDILLSFNGGGRNNEIQFNRVCPGSAIKDLPNSVHGLVGALYAIGGEDCQFLHPNSPYFGQDPK